MNEDEFNKGIFMILKCASILFGGRYQPMDKNGSKPAFALSAS